MNVTVEDLGPCKKQVRVEADPTEVQAAYERVITDLQKVVNLPGFRPGKAPRHMIQRTLGAKLDKEVREKMVQDALSKAFKEHNVHPVADPDVEVTQFGQGKSFQLVATMETEPEFEVPDYKGLPVRRDTRTVTDEDVGQAIEVLRQQRASYLDVQRPVARGDFAVVNFVGASEGKPLTEIAPSAPGLCEQKKFWLHVEAGEFIPGFAERLIGAQAGERRTVTVGFPADFVASELAGKQATYEVEVLQIKEKKLPALDEQLAKSFGAGGWEEFVKGVREDLEHELKYKQGREIRSNLVATLLGRVSFELPDSLVQHETKSVVFDIVRENAQRGVSKEVIDERKEEIYSYAASSARERVKADIILNRIAEKENIAATRDEVVSRVYQLATQYKVKPEKMAKDLQERGGIGQIQQEIMRAKVLDLLEMNARFE